MSASLAVSGLLASSTGSALLRKVLFQLDGVGLHGQRHTFEKPWFTTWESAIACWVSIVLFWIMQGFTRWSKRRAEVDAEVRETLLGEHEDEEPDPSAEAKEVEMGERGSDADTNQNNEEQEFHATWREVWALIVPGAFSVLSIIVQGMGLRYISASLSMMLSGSCIVFTAILSVLLLKCRLNYLHLSGVVLSLAGIAIVCIANLVWPEVSHSTHHHHDNYLAEAQLFGPLFLGSREGVQEIVLGIFLTLLSSLILAMRLVSEEFGLRGTDMHPLQVLGYEGMWGFFLVGALGLPLVQVIPGGDIDGCQENTADSFVMLAKNGDMNAINWLFFLSVIGLNVFGLMVTSRLGSVFRAVLLTTRTAAVWALDLILFNLHIGGGSLGEPWENPASWFQLFGFTLLLLGTVIYAQGSSAVAQDDEHRKHSADDPEADDDEPPSRRTTVSAVTRLRPYTSLYIPHGIPRDIVRPALSGQGIGRRAVSLPQVPRVLGASPHADSPMTGFNPHNFQRHSYTSGILQGSSPRSMRSEEEGRPSQPGMRRSASRLFMQTLTHPSSWVLPLHTPIHRGSTPSSASHALEDTIDSPASAPLEGLPTSRSPVERARPFNYPAQGILDLRRDDEEHNEQQQGRKPRAGQSPSPQNLLEYRRSLRKAKARMPSVRESDAEAVRASVDQAVALSTSAPSSIQPQHSDIAPDWACQGIVIEREIPPLDLPDAKQKHIFGQSPAAPVLLSRRSTGRSKKARLPSFSEEDDGSENPSPKEDEINSAEQGSGEHQEGHRRSLSGSSTSSRSSMLGRSPTPAKLMEQRSAEKRALDRLPVFQEEGAEGRFSSSSSLGTSEDEEKSLWQKVSGDQADSESSEENDISKLQRTAPNSSQLSQQLDSGLKKAKGGSSNDLQWNGEPMSL